MRARRFLPALLALALGCRPAAPPRPSLLLVTIDTLRADRVGCYGSSEGTTPALDRLAAEGVRVARAYATAPITAPSHASLLTGRYPLRHGVRTNGLYVLPDREETLAEVLHARGYRTAAFVGGVPLDHRFGFAQGFHVYDDDFSRSVIRGQDLSPWYDIPLAERERRADEVLAPAVAWLEENHREPFFLWVHFFDPHSPYAPPSPFDRRFYREGDPRSPAERSLEGLWSDPKPWHAWLRGVTDAAYVRALYAGEVAFVDAQVGRLLAALERLGRAGDTAVVVTSDHGEGLGEHGEYFFHGDLVYETTLRVPLLLRAPWRLSAGRVAAGPARGVDLFPTVLELLGATAPAGVDAEEPVREDGRAPRQGAGKGRSAPPIDGVSLLGELLGSAAGERPVLAEAAYRDRSGRGVFAYLEGTRKVIATDARPPAPSALECFDLTTDPGELRSACERRPEEFALLRASLEELRRSLEGPEPRPAQVDPEVIEALRSLGYQGD